MGRSCDGAGGRLVVLTVGLFAGAATRCGVRLRPEGREACRCASPRYFGNLGPRRGSAGRGAGRRRAAEAIEREAARRVALHAAGAQDLDGQTSHPSGITAVNPALTDDPVKGGVTGTGCDPVGFPRLALWNLRTIRLIQSPENVVVLYMLNNKWRVIRTDIPELPKEFDEPRWHGYSVGRWEDDYTFVAQTSGIDERTWIDAAGRPHSEELRVTERYRRVGPRAPAAHNHDRRPEDVHEALGRARHVVETAIADVRYSRNGMRAVRDGGLQRGNRQARWQLAGGRQVAAGSSTRRDGYSTIAPADDARPSFVPFASTAARMRPIGWFSLTGSTVIVT